jgi:hypothetical protein
MRKPMTSTPAAPRDWLRFGVADPQGRWADTWKLWSQPIGGRPCFCIGNRDLGGHYVFQARSSGGWHAAFVPRGPGAGRAAVAKDPRVELPLQELGADAVACLVALRMLTQPTDIAFPDICGRFRFIARIPGHTTLATETRIVVVGSGGRAAWPTATLAGWVVLGSLELGRGVRVAVVYRFVEPEDNDSAFGTGRQPGVDHESDDLPASASCLARGAEVTL